MKQHQENKGGGRKSSPQSPKEGRGRVKRNAIKAGTGCANHRAHRGDGKQRGSVENNTATDLQTLRKCLLDGSKYVLGSK